MRDALIVLGTTLTDTSQAFGLKNEVDPIPRLFSAATTWGGNPRKDAIYLNFTPPNGWSYTARLYRPRGEILSGKWKFPQPQPAS